MKYRTIIGLETHVELSTRSKMFCGCSANYFGQKPNVNVCPVCLGLPGALPVPNEQAIKWTILIGLALNCQINLNSYFERKHYFYPDLPKGYQISQYAKPLCYDGYLMINHKKIRINRVHLEEDTGKLLHGQQFNDKSSYIDFNRSGVPLVEIVTEPDVENATQAADYLKQLQLLIQYLGASDCDMEKGSMRCEPNISVIELQDWQKNHQLPNFKVEVKNINSFKFVQKAIQYEEKRQTSLLQNKQLPKQETRRYLESNGQTETMRSKEFAQDYRYFPEPDIPPLKFDLVFLNKLKKQLKTLTLPSDRQIRLENQYGLSKFVAWQLTENKKLGDRYLEIVAKSQDLDKLKLANLLINKKIKTNLTTAEFLTKAKQLLSKKSLDQDTLVKTIKNILANNPKAIKDYQQGKQTAIQFLLGQCLKILGRQIEINQLRELLIKELSLKQ